MPFARNVYVVGCAMTRFGRSEGSLLDIIEEASLGAIADSGLDATAIRSVIVANMGAGILNHMTGLGSATVDRLSLYPAAAEVVENGPASGGSAAKVGACAVASGLVDVALVVGAEKMRDVTGWESTDFVATLSQPQVEYIYGVTLPSLAGMFARLYMEKYGIEPRHLAMVAIKNHANALKNPYAHIQQAITMEGILTRPEAVVNNPPVAEPLRMFDCCPVSDGAAALVLASEEVARRLPHRVRIAGIGQATDTHAVHERKDPTELTAVRLAAKQAFDMAGVKPADVDVAELHDAFTILEIAESEEVGFFKKGTGHVALEKGETSLTGKLPINPSGGLKAKGHPVGATGVAQLAELTWQLRGEAGERQVKGAKTGFSCNFGGFGNNVVAFVLSGEK
ncbi:MAG: acetyl-CoA acetyltransferase [Candidatus Eisenbacteria bacterium]